MRRSSDIYHTTPCGRSPREWISGVSAFTLQKHLLHFAVPSCPDLWFPLWWSSIAWPWAPSTSSLCARTTVARTTHLSFGSPPNTWTLRELLNLLDEALAGTLHLWRKMPTPPFPSRPGRGLTTVDGDGGGGHPHSRQRMHLQTIITSPCWMKELIENPLADARVCPGLGSDCATLSSSEVITDCPRGS